MRNKILSLLTELLMVFLGVLLAFITTSWAERQRDEKYVNFMVGNLIQDVRNDSALIVNAITMVKTQHDSLSILIQHLGKMDFEHANPHLYWTYFSYNVFEPSNQAFEFMVFGGDMKLVDDLEKIRMIKELDHVNKKLNLIHLKYFESIEAFRNTFVCQYNMEEFDFGEIPQDNRIEFWNRVNFLKSSVKNYYDVLVLAQSKYNIFLEDLRATG